MCSEISPWEQLRQLDNAIVTAVPPIDPPVCHWLRDDAAESYCREHAWMTAWLKNNPIGPHPEEPDWIDKNDNDEEIAENIGGYAGTDSDSPEYCSVCGRTLDYFLTEAGVDYELSHFAQNPISKDEIVTSELTFTLSRIFNSLEHPSANQEDVKEALKLANDCMTAINEANSATSACSVTKQGQ